MVNATANQLSTEVQFEEQLEQLATFVRVMRHDGLPIEEALRAPINDPGMRKQLVRFWLSGGYEPTTAQTSARQIMGKDFFGIEEAVTHFGVKPTRAQLLALSEVPFSETELREAMDGHVLVAVFPLSILEVRDRVKCKLFRDHDTAWYNQLTFAMDRGDVSWQLVQKANKICRGRQRLLNDNEETPSARVMVYTIIGHYLSTGERLLEKSSVRCSDITSDGNNVGVGDFGEDGLSVASYRGCYRIE